MFNPKTRFFATLRLLAGILGLGLCAPAFADQTVSLTVGANYTFTVTASGTQPFTYQPLAPLPSRLWTELLDLAQIKPDTRWSAFSRTAQQSLLRILTATELPVSGKSLNKDEFVTCGGIRLSEVNFKTMESKLVPGLYFAGELLDIDGITGGFNFQAAWTTGWLAGKAIADSQH